MIVYGFVIKNSSPLYQKVQILHATLGKIVCVYSRNHVARQLTTGSIILCSVAPFHSLYQFEYLEIMQSIPHDNLETLQFIHDILKICMYLIPDNVSVSDIFEYIMYAYKNISLLSPAGKHIVILRLFMMCDIFGDNPDIYKIAMQDPMEIITSDCKYLEALVKRGYHEMLHQKNMS